MNHDGSHQPMDLHCGSGYTSHCILDPITNECVHRNHVCNTEPPAISNELETESNVGGPLADRVVVDDDAQDLVNPQVNAINIHKHVTSTYNEVYSWTMRHKVLAVALASWCVFCLLTCGVVCYYGKKKRTKERHHHEDEILAAALNSDDTEGHSMLDMDENQPDEGDDIESGVDEYDSVSEMDVVNRKRGRL